MYGKLDNKWLRIEKISYFPNEQNLNAELIDRKNHEQNDIPIKNRSRFVKFMKVQSWADF